MLKKQKSDAVLNLKMTLRTAKTTSKKRWREYSIFQFKTDRGDFYFVTAFF
jgi:hypothetical protein